MSFRIRLIIPRLGGYLVRLPGKPGWYSVAYPYTSELHILCTYSTLNGNNLHVLQRRGRSTSLICNSRGTTFPTRDVP
jgi:hypothetical protein